MSRLAPETINSCFPIARVKVYKNGCYKIVRKSLMQDDYLPNGGSQVKELSNKSLLNLIWTINATDVEFHSMITLTYPADFPANGATVKEDLRVYNQWLRGRFKTEILWFLEFQKRGAPHFHVLLETKEITPEMRRDAGLKWVQRVITSDWFMACFRVFNHGKEIEFDWQAYKTEVAKIAKVQFHDTFWQLAKSENGMRNYAAKYAAKEYQKQPPKHYTEVGRFWGCSSGVKPKEITEVDTCEEDIRAMLEAIDHAAANWEVIPKLLFNANKVKSQPEPESEQIAMFGELD